MQTQPSLDEAADRLERNAAIAGVVPAVLVGVLLVFVQPVIGVVVGVLLAVGWVVAIRGRIAAAPLLVLASMPSEPLAPGSQPRLENLLEGLGVTSGVAELDVALVDSAALNALVAVGRGRPRVLLTTALVEHLDRLELEGVLANLLGRVKDGSARYSTTVLALLGSSPRATKMLASHLGEQRSVLSDLAAVDLTRYPPGLMSALSTMAEHGTELREVPPSTGPLWLAPAVPSASGDQGAEFQPLSLRIAVLAEL